jgi:hypothetical protein
MGNIGDQDGQKDVFVAINVNVKLMLNCGYL